MTVKPKSPLVEEEDEPVAVPVVEHVIFGLVVGGGTVPSDREASSCRVILTGEEGFTTPVMTTLEVPPPLGRRRWVRLVVEELRDAAERVVQLVAIEENDPREVKNTTELIFFLFGQSNIVYNDVSIKFLFASCLQNFQRCNFYEVFFS